MFCIGRRSNTDATYKAPKHPLLVAVLQFLCIKELTNMELTASMLIGKAV